MDGSRGNRCAGQDRVKDEEDKEEATEWAAGQSSSPSKRRRRGGPRVAKPALEAACGDGARQLGQKYVYGSGEWIKSRPARPGQQRPLAAWPHRGTAGGPCGTAQARDSRPCAAARAPGRLRGHGVGEAGGGEPGMWRCSEVRQGQAGVVRFNWWRCNNEHLLPRWQCQHAG